MRFQPHSSAHGAVLPHESLPAVAGTYKAGELLVMSSGKLTKISATLNTTPPFLCMSDTAVADGAPLAVVRVSPDTVFETTLSGAAATAVPGGKLSVATGGLQVITGTGTFEVVYAEGTTAGSVVRGRFV